MVEEKGKVVCVTAAGGYVASWLVKLLLSEAYIVHGTVREPGMLGVFHVASPLPTAAVQNPEVELIEPAVKGTLNVLKASLAVKVKRVVVVSSVAAVTMNPSWPKDQVKDEICWSDKELQKKVKGYESRENKLQKIVDVHDVTEALLLAYEKPEAEGRYICMAHLLMAKDLVEKLRSIYLHYNYPKSVTEGGEEPNMSSKKLQNLGWSYKSLEETLIDSIESYRTTGLMD